MRPAGLIWPLARPARARWPRAAGSTWSRCAAARWRRRCFPVTGCSSRAWAAAAAGRRRAGRRSARPGPRADQAGGAHRCRRRPAARRQPRRQHRRTGPQHSVARSAARYWPLERRAVAALLAARRGSARSRAPSRRADRRPDAHSGTSSTGSEPAAHRLSGRPSLQPWYFAASSCRASGSRSSPSITRALAVERATADPHPDSRLDHAGCAPSARARGRRPGSRHAHRRSRTRSRSSAAARSPPGGLEVADRVARVRRQHVGGVTRSRRRPPRRHAAVELVRQRARRPRPPRPRRAARSPAVGRTASRAPGTRSRRKSNDRPEPGVAVLGADRAGVDHHQVGRRSVTAWCSRAASL